jgi:hypothetical protein
MFSDNRSRASVIGYAVHFANGLVFSLGYAAIFAAVRRAGWALGLGLGGVDALFAGGGLVTVLLSAIHPRMGTHWTDASTAASRRSSA